MFQSSFELTGYITELKSRQKWFAVWFQSSFELTGYITDLAIDDQPKIDILFQSSFELTGYITNLKQQKEKELWKVSKLFRAYGLYNESKTANSISVKLFQSSFELTGYITIRP